MICYYEESSVKRELEHAANFHEIFSLVQAAVRHTINESRAGLNLGIMEMGNDANKFLGAFYPAGSNIIVLNSTPLRRIGETNEELFRPYVFHVLLHEYLHSLGYLDERTVRQLAYRICAKVLGDGHISTRMTSNIDEFFPNLVYPRGSPAVPDKMILIEDLDGGMDYID